MSTAQKYLFVLILTGGLVALDLGTKNWAEVHLATPFHPIPVAVEGDDDGKSLGEVIEARLGKRPDDTWVKEHVLRTNRSQVLKSDAVLYKENGKPLFRHLYAFTKQDLDIPPRLILNTQYELRRQWLGWANPKLDDIQLDQELGKAASKTTLTNLLAERIPFLDEETAGPIANGYTYRLSSAPKMAIQPDGSIAPLSGTTRVREGDIFLITGWNVDVIPSFLRFSYAENPGAAWGFLGDSGPQFRHTFFIIVSIIAAGLIIFFLIRLENQHTLYIVAFSSILSGALGNFVDRLRYRFVVDFIDMYVGDAHWPTYNVADIAITVGVALLILDMLIRGDESPLLAKPKKETEAKEEA